MAQRLLSLAAVLAAAPTLLGQLNQLKSIHFSKLTRRDLRRTKTSTQTSMPEMELSDQ